MSIWKLRLATILLAIAVFLAGSLVLYGAMMLLDYLGVLTFTPRLFIMANAVLCTLIVLGQWLFAPYIIEMFYNCVEADPVRHRKLYEIVEDLARRSGLKQVPKVMIAHIPIPNAFAYGSPLTGPRVAVTKPLLEMLDENELRAVLGHEIGHLKHRDVAWMLAIGLIPTIIWSIGETLIRLGFWAPIFGATSEREGYTVPVIWMLIGFLLLAVAFILNIFVLAFSRYREYFADRHSVALNPNGGVYLQRALAKIVLATRPYLAEEASHLASLMQFKALFIQDPIVGEVPYIRDIDEFIEYLKNRKLTLWDRIRELFSTHPDITKRLRMLDKFNEEFWGGLHPRLYTIPVH